MGGRKEGVPVWGIGILQWILGIGLTIFGQCAEHKEQWEEDLRLGRDMNST